MEAANLYYTEEKRLSKHYWNLPESNKGLKNLDIDEDSTASDFTTSDPITESTQSSSEDSTVVDSSTMSDSIPSTQSSNEDSTLTDSTISEEYSESNKCGIEDTESDSTGESTKERSDNETTQLALIERIRQSLENLEEEEEMDKLKEKEKEKHEEDEQKEIEELLADFAPPVRRRPQNSNPNWRLSLPNGEVQAPTHSARPITIMIPKEAEIPMNKSGTFDRRHRRASSVASSNPPLFKLSDLKKGLTESLSASPSNSETMVKETNVIDRKVEDGNKMINQYMILEELGRGVQGKVKLCLDVNENKFYALKIVKKVSRKKLGMKDSPLDKIKLEIAILKKCDHPNVVKLIEVLDNPETEKIYLVLEYLEGGTVNWNLDEETGKAPLDITSSRRYFRDVVLGLEYLHYQGVVHRDIKPANLLITKEGRVKIADFGVSYLSENEEIDQSELESCNGSPAFMAPELIERGSQILGPSIDVWALGVTLYCFIFGKLPFGGKGEWELFQEILHKKPEYYEYEADKDLIDLFERMLNKDPSKRPTASEIIRHPWVLADLQNKEEWIENNDPKKKAAIQVTQDEVKNAITTFLGRIKRRIIDFFQDGIMKSQSPSPSPSQSKLKEWNKDEWANAHPVFTRPQTSQSRSWTIRASMGAKDLGTMADFYKNYVPPSREEIEKRKEEIEQLVNKSWYKSNSSLRPRVYPPEIKKKPDFRQLTSEGEPQRRSWYLRTLEPKRDLNEVAYAYHMMGKVQSLNNTRSLLNTTKIQQRRTPEKEERLRELFEESLKLVSNFENSSSESLLSEINEVDFQTLSGSEDLEVSLAVKKYQEKNNAFSEAQTELIASLEQLRKHMEVYKTSEKSLNREGMRTNLRHGSLSPNAPRHRHSPVRPDQRSHSFGDVSTTSSDLEEEKRKNLSSSDISERDSEEKEKVKVKRKDTKPKTKTHEKVKSNSNSSSEKEEKHSKRHSHSSSDEKPKNKNSPVPGSDKNKEKEKSIFSKQDGRASSKKSSSSSEDKSNSSNFSNLSEELSNSTTSSSSSERDEKPKKTKEKDTEKRKDKSKDTEEKNKERPKLKTEFINEEWTDPRANINLKKLHPTKSESDVTPPIALRNSSLRNSVGNIEPKSFGMTNDKVSRKHRARSATLTPIVSVTA